MLTQPPFQDGNGVATASSPWKRARQDNEAVAAGWTRGEGQGALETSKGVLKLEAWPPGGQDAGVMLLFRHGIPEGWVEKVRSNIGPVLVDHAHLERKAATTAITLEKYRQLYGRVHELNAIAIEELQHFELVLQLLKARGVAFGQPVRSPWISGMMGAVRAGNNREQVIDHLLCCALIEGRSCEKFQLLARELAREEPELAAFYGSLVESEGNHYATYLLMARHIDEAETDRRLDWFLDLDARLIREPHALAILH